MEHINNIEELFNAIQEDLPEAYSSDKLVDVTKIMFCHGIMLGLSMAGARPENIVSNSCDRTVLQDINEVLGIDMSEAYKTDGVVIMDGDEVVH